MTVEDGHPAAGLGKRVEISSEDASATAGPALAACSHTSVIYHAPGSPVGIPSDGRVVQKAVRAVGGTNPRRVDHAQRATSRRVTPHAPSRMPPTAITTEATIPKASHWPIIGWPIWAVRASWWNQSGSLRAGARRSMR